MGKFDKHRNNKSSERSESKSQAPARSSKIEFQVTVPQCKVCQSPNRPYIDRLLTLGIPASQIADQYSAIDGISYSRKSMANHKNKHLTLRDAAIRRIVEKRAEEAGIDVEQTAETLLTSRSILEAMVHRGYESFISGETKVRPEDLMAALKQLQDEESEYYQVQLELLDKRYREELDAFMTAVQMIVPPGMHQDIIMEFKRRVGEIENRGMIQIERQASNQ